jgi:hypothetical protein
MSYTAEQIERLRDGLCPWCGNLPRRHRWRRKSGCTLGPVLVWHLIQVQKITDREEER